MTCSSRFLPVLLAWLALLSFSGDGSMASSSNRFGGLTAKQYYANLKKTLAQINRSSGRITTQEAAYLRTHPHSTATRQRTAPLTPATSTHVPGYVPAAYVPWVQGAAQSTGLPAAVVAAQINDESGFNPQAKSSKGAEGIAQFEPGTFKSYGSGSPYNPADAQRAYINYMNTLLSQYNGNVRNALAAYDAGPANLQAGYGYADLILSAAGVPQATTTTGGSSTYGGTRPGGQPATSGDSGSSGQGVQGIFADYENELTLPRMAPADVGAKNAFSWWLNSFTNQWNQENG